jgi:hypothetical protein
MSKIPSSRFDKDAQSTWFGTDPTQQLREEINFGRFVGRIRNAFAEIMLKPLRIQLSLSIPDIKNDKRILDSISLRFNSYNQFEEMANIEIMTKRVEFIGTMKDNLTVTDAEGEETPYFSPKFLILKYLKMSEADLELNDKYKKEEELLKKLKAGTDSDDGSDEETTDDELGSDESTDEKGEDTSLDLDDTGSGSEDDSSDIDDEMMGDVMSDLQSRRSIITGMDANNGRQVIKARTPLIELDGYSTALKSITQGKGKIKTTFAEYAPVPGELQKKLHEEYRKTEVEHA